jgi:hypothetical protein
VLLDMSRLPDVFGFSRSETAYLSHLQESEGPSKSEANKTKQRLSVIYQSEIEVYVSQ